MPIEVILPKVDMDMATGKIADWHRAEGELVNEGEALFDIETDKATMEVESPGTGTLHFVSAKKGDEVPIGQVVAWLFSNGEEVVAPAVAAAPAKVPSPDESAALQTNEIMSAAASSSGKSLRATPVARRLAKDRGIELTLIVGTGPRGRITRADVEDFDGSKSDVDVAPSVGSGITSAETGAQKAADNLGLSYDLIPVGKMRAVIAKHLAESKSTVPHFYLDADIHLDALLALRNQFNAPVAEIEVRKISINDFLVRACALALKKVPKANAAWDGDHIVQYRNAHISVAVAVDGGLLTPVVREAETKGLREVSDEIADLAERARAGKLGSDELKGGSFSISNLGMFGVKSFNAIINPPEAMILAVGQGVKQFVPDDNGNPKLATVVSVTLSCDHRVVDGALGAVWLQEFKSLVENPLEIVLM